MQGWEKVSRSDPYYKACLTVASAGGAIAGGAVGSFLGPAGTGVGYLGGAAEGLAAGYLACPYLAPYIRAKFEQALPLTEADLRSAAEAMTRHAGVEQAADAVKLLAMVRSLGPSAGSRAACLDPRLAARQLLAQA
jgi:hypothetical protein